MFGDERFKRYGCSEPESHTIAVVKMSESHETLAATLSPVLDEVKGLMKSRKIQVGGTTFELQFHLGGDLKLVCHYMCYI
ncbi:hypothetical protein EMCRGX_G004724 [Ephydatia muelleri]